MGSKLINDVFPPAMEPELFMQFISRLVTDVFRLELVKFIKT
jgi:hypothetical protein